jgi:hypothetical protein
MEIRILNFSSLHALPSGGGKQCDLSDVGFGVAGWTSTVPYVQLAITSIEGARVLPPRIVAIIGPWRRGSYFT